MQITVQFHGILEQISGLSERRLHAAPSATVAEALTELLAEIPDLAAWLPRTACAIGSELVPRHYPLSDGECLVLIPPVSGG